MIRGETVTFDGTYHHVKEAVLDPAPARRIPILVAGHRPRMMRLTAEWADAWNTAWYGAPGEKVAERLGTLEDAVRAAGKQAGSVAPTVGFIVRDPDQPSVPDPDQNAFSGSIPELAEALAAYQKLGVDHLIVSPEPMTPKTVQRIAEARRLMNS